MQVQYRGITLDPATKTFVHEFRDKQNTLKDYHYLPDGYEATLSIHECCRQRKRELVRLAYLEHQKKAFGGRSITTEKQSKSAPTSRSSLSSSPNTLYQQI